MFIRNFEFSRVSHFCHRATRSLLLLFLSISSFAFSLFSFFESSWTHFCKPASIFLFRPYSFNFVSFRFIRLCYSFFVLFYFFFIYLFIYSFLFFYFSFGKREAHPTPKNRRPKKKKKKR